MTYEDALQELSQVSLSQFVAERKRLAAELKSSGDAAGAKRLLERKKPPVSAWVVNQLYWHARDAFDEMLATAEQLRKGHLQASAHHREAIAKLRQRAAAILEDAGHPPTEATLRRVTTTLSALAASGGFEPDPPGALEADRDPPGFEAVGIPAIAAHADEEGEAAPAPAPKHTGKAALAQARDEAEERRRAELAEKKRIEEERKRRKAERHKLESALRAAQNELAARERTIEQLDKQLVTARREAADARVAVADIESKLAALGDD